MSKTINLITARLSKPYFRKILINLGQTNKENADTICKYILAEQAEINIKNSTREGKIKVLVWLSNFFEDRKRYKDMTKDDTLPYLNKLRKPQNLYNGWINSIIIDRWFS